MNLHRHLTSFLLASLLTLSGSLGLMVSTPSEAAGRNVVQALTATEINDLLWMREEEKLARDVYIGLNQRWNERVFANISASEQKHMDAIKSRMDRYRLPDPALPQIGAFSNNELQNLYNDLMAKGTASLISALRVGAYIEEIDILDLQIALENTSHQDIQMVYQNLLEGSKNHLRAFVRRLQSLDVIYMPVELDNELYQLIMDL